MAWWVSSKFRRHDMPPSRPDPSEKTATHLPSPCSMSVTVQPGSNDSNSSTISSHEPREITDWAVMPVPLLTTITQPASPCSMPVTAKLSFHCSSMYDRALFHELGGLTPCCP